MAHHNPYAPAATLVVAADFDDPAKALTLAEKLSGLPVWFKVGLELFTVAGPAIIRDLRAQGIPIFLDLKMHDIPNTVRSAVRAASLSGVRMLTIHASGGSDMCRAAVAGREEALASGAPSPGPLLMGVTVLTSQSGAPADVTAKVEELALLAQHAGLDGVVCSGCEAAAVKRACGTEFLCLCPGIRFPGYTGKDDQSRVCTPDQAVTAGADFLVIGRPVTQADDPIMAVQTAFALMQSGNAV